MGNADSIREAMCQLPATFGLRAYPGTFRVSERASYVSGHGVVMLYTQRQVSERQFESLYGRAPLDADELWVDFAKGTLDELRAQVRP